MKKIILIFLFFSVFAITMHAQNVGVGETSPANKLSVKGNLSVGSGFSATVAPTDGAIIQGNVGIGTATISGFGGRTLQVSGTGNVALVLEKNQCYCQNMGDARGQRRSAHF